MRGPMFNVSEKIIMFNILLLKQIEFTHSCNLLESRYRCFKLNVLKALCKHFSNDVLKITIFMEKLVRI